jgi:hypothetical protein
MKKLDEPVEVSGIVKTVTLIKDDGAHENLSFEVKDGVVIITSPPVCANPEQTFELEITAD